jgi:signal peptidase I
MLPTIEHDDRLLVNKLLRPRRWDLVVYWNDDPQEKLAFCKRLIGLPGEKLRFEGGNLYVNDEVVQMPPVLAGRNLMHPGTVHRAPGRYNDGTAIVLGPEEYFFVGDNLDMSLDSRQLGPSPSSSIIGVVDVLYWPLGRARIFR